MRCVSDSKQTAIYAVSVTKFKTKHVRSSIQVILMQEVPN